MLECVEAELHLENTLLNGQCFNWWKTPTAQHRYEGVFRSHFLMMERLTPTQVQVEVEPHPTNSDSFQRDFRDYLILDVNISKHYADWSERDPKYFG